ncbi:enoyl-CoA hydratase/isomerase family protein [Azospirillum argentinense]
MTITSNVEDRIGTITIDRAEKLNALDPEHLRALRRHLAGLSSDPSVNVIVITGAGGRAFCVGADLTSAPASDAGVAEAFPMDLELAGENGLYIRLFDLSGLQIRKPVIAAVDGYCLGGGLELALQCDLVVASDKASFGLPEVAVASVPGGGGATNLMRAIPRAVAMRMLLTGERIDAQRALAVGLVSDVWTVERFADETKALARRIADNGPLAVQMVKMLASQTATLPSLQTFQLTELAWGLLRDTADRREGRQAFAEKRKPVYIGR